MNEQSQANLSSWFDKTAAKIKQDADRIETDYFVPWKDVAAKSYVEHPVAFSFLTIFAALSALPVASFLGFAILTTSVLTFSALTFAILTSGAIIVSAAFILFGVLFLQLLIASSLTFSGIALYVAYRLFFHLHDPSGGGVRAWSQETRANVPNPWKARDIEQSPPHEPNGAEAASAHS
ncbi:hypothetical protein EXIGLDRAFT_830761 [Exidia glandulosa HHB12029]|uniref:Uncharacterized protein n=1 Tax=Exidia glandulosa HHB12029 TaxID=1314781 RepID=A0A165N7X4_EXIGL|nr:hypothetical protein EXIGLDRAFT_830761 [Exidia glandulosa HHB12029]